MNAIKELAGRMQNKIGPLPTWAWVAIPAGAYIAYSYYRAATSAPPVDPMAGGGAAGTEAMGYGINTGGAYLPSYGATPSGSSNLPSVETPNFTNESWFRQVTNWLIGEGVLPSDAVTAINAYIFGTPEEITPTQLNALQRALTQFGTPPEGGGFIPKAKPVPPTTTPPTTTPPKTTPKATVPGPVAGLSVFVNQPGLMRIRWQAPSGAGSILGYQAQVKSLAGIWVSLPQPASWYAEFKPQPNNNYTFRVRARNAKGWGPYATVSARSQ